MQKSLWMELFCAGSFMGKVFVQFEEILNKLSLLCHVEKEELKVVLWENSQLVNLLKPASWSWTSRVIHVSVLRLTPIRLVNCHSVRELEMVRALWRVPVEECATEGHLDDWSVCLSTELILPADEVSPFAHSPAPLQDVQRHKLPTVKIHPVYLRMH